MVAQQILVLFVQVRILVVQPHFKIHSPSKEDASQVTRPLFLYSRREVFLHLRGSIAVRIRRYRRTCTSVSMLAFVGIDVHLYRH